MPDAFDLAQLAALEDQGVPAGLWFPTAPFPDGLNTRQPIQAGITSVDKAYSTRALWAMAYLWNRATAWPDPVIREKLLFTVTSLYQRVTWFSEFRFWGGSSNTANYNVPAIANEQNVFKTFERKAKTIFLYFQHAPALARHVEVRTSSACHLPHVRSQSVDYVFTDPPFGSNINYSEMNFLWESWLGVRTDTTEEAIVNKVQGKGFGEYQNLLTLAFAEVGRVLKEGGWLSVVFHNSSAQVWQALQEAIRGAGFTIEGTQTFDKKHGTFKMFVSDNAVGYDLVLNCRKATQEVTAYPVEPNARLAVAGFIQQQLAGSLANYQVNYLHVHREPEFDYRRLYAEWLAFALPRVPVTLSFGQFRLLADQFLPLVAAGS